jgi:predicted RNase H-like nuclease (RuvC/YqgF family)
MSGESAMAVAALRVVVGATRDVELAVARQRHEDLRDHIGWIEARHEVQIVALDTENRRLEEQIVTLVTENRGLGEHVIVLEAMVMAQELNREMYNDGMERHIILRRDYDAERARSARLEQQVHSLARWAVHRGGVPAEVFQSLGIDFAEERAGDGVGPA